MTYDFNLYDHVESGQASIYRLKYVDSDNGQFIFTNDFGFASLFKTIPQWVVLSFASFPQSEVFDSFEKK